MLYRRLLSSGAVTARRARHLCHFGAVAVLAIAPAVIPGVAPTAAADDCPDAEVVFARGTDESPGMGRVGDALVDSLRQQASGLNIRDYAVNYKATITQRHGGDGAKDAINHIKSTANSCPNTKIVLGGYSQGASVVNIVTGASGINWGDPLPSEYTKNVVAVATFGNVADRTAGSPTTQNTAFSAKTIDMCNPADPVCHSGPGNAWSGHTQGYVPAYTNQAAAFVAARLLAGTSQAVPGYGSALPSYGSQLPVYGYGPQSTYGAPQSTYGGPQSSYGMTPDFHSGDGMPPGPPLAPGPTVAPAPAVTPAPTAAATPTPTPTGLV